MMGLPRDTSKVFIGLYRGMENPMEKTMDMQGKLRVHRGYAMALVFLDSTEGSKGNMS